MTLPRRRPTLEHYLAAVDIARQGGTADHPYEQSSWGSSECGTPCCIHGHACLLAGLPVTGLTVAPTAGVEVVCSQASADTALALADAGVMALDDDRIVAVLDTSGWSADRIVAALSDGWDDDARVVDALSARWDDDDARVVAALSDGWDDDRIVAALSAAGWDDDRIVAALSDGWGDDDARVVDALSARWSADRVVAAMA